MCWQLCEVRRSTGTEAWQRNNKRKSKRDLDGSIGEICKRLILIKYSVDISTSISEDICNMRILWFQMLRAAQSGVLQEVLVDQFKMTKKGDRKICLTNVQVLYWLEQRGSHHSQKLFQKAEPWRFEEIVDVAALLVKPSVSENFYFFCLFVDKALKLIASSRF